MTDESNWIASAPTDLPWISNVHHDIACAYFEDGWTNADLNGTVHAQHHLVGIPVAEKVHACRDHQRNQHAALAADEVVAQARQLWRLCRERAVGFAQVHDDPFSSLAHPLCRRKGCLGMKPIDDQDLCRGEIGPVELLDFQRFLQQAPRRHKSALAAGIADENKRHLLLGGVPVNQAAQIDIVVCQRPALQFAQGAAAHSAHIAAANAQAGCRHRCGSRRPAALDGDSLRLPLMAPAR